MKIGELTLNEIKAKCPNNNYGCDVCDYCNYKKLCFSKIFELFNSLDQEIEVEDND